MFVDGRQTRSIMHRMISSAHLDMLADDQLVVRRRLRHLYIYLAQYGYVRSSALRPPYRNERSASSLHVELGPKRVREEQEV